LGKAEAISNRHSQALILRLVGAPNRLEKQVQALCYGSGEDSELAEAVQDLAEDMRVAAPCRELPCFSEERGSLVLRITQTSEVVHDLGAYRCSLDEVLWRLR
jgi:hypothetical protein